jgi:serpin B
MRYLGLLLPLFLGSSVCACSQDYTDIGSSQSRDTSPSTADVPQLSSDDASFAFNLYRAQVGADSTSNIFYSPYSISVALAMTYAGSAGNTASQIASAMQFTLPPAQLDAAFDAVDLALRSRQGIKLAIANSIWGQQSLSYGAPFLATLAVDFGSEVRGVDFINAAPQAENAINGWVADQTSGKITNLFAPGALDSTTRVVLVNAIYFDASWQTKFDPSATAPATFTKLDGSTVSASMMSVTNLSVSIAALPTYTAVDIPYAGGQTSMLVVMPNGDEFPSVEAGLSGDALGSIVTSLTPQTDVTLELPKFTLQGTSVSLKPALSTLGITDAFDPTAANLSPMVTSEQLYIADIVHQAYVMVDESGTVAAAATAVSNNDFSAESSTSVTINRPFFFFIRDIPTGTVLFVGRVMDPTQTQSGS